MSDEKQQSINEYYDQMRRQIEHEDDLITQRLSWLMASQSFLFTAYAIVLNGLQPHNGGTPLETTKLNFCHLVPIAGIVSSALIYASIWGGVLEIRTLRKLWSSLGLEAAPANLPPIQSGGLPFLLGQMTAPSFPRQKPCTRRWPSGSESPDPSCSTPPSLRTER